MNSKILSGPPDIHGGRQHSQLMTLEHRNETNEREKFIRKLLLGNIRYNPKTAAELGIRLSDSCFSVVLVRINGNETISLSDLSDIIYAVRNIGEELYGAFSECYGVDIDGVTIGFLLNHGSECGFIRGQSSDIKRHIIELFGVHTTMSLCTLSIKSPDDCSRLYKNARYAMLYRLSFEPYSIIDYKDTISMSRQSCEYPVLLEREIVDCIRTRNETFIKRGVGAFIRTVDSMSYDTIVLHTTRLLLAVNALLIGAGLENEVVLSSIVEDLGALDSINDLLIFTEKRCIGAMRIISSQNKDTKRDVVISNILKYIDENYTDSDLTVEVIASAVNRSSNYIRSIFKASQGISISEYITRKRFDQVCKMLIETNLSARDIGRAVGLNSGSYFYTSFRRYTGSTPDKYRKAHRPGLYDSLAASAADPSAGGIK